jgi:hypothetical protein
VSKSRRQLDELISAVCHGRADTAQMRELASQLRSDRSAIDRYLEYVDLHASLSTDPQLFFGASNSRASHELPVVKEVEVASRQSVRRIVVAIAGAATVAAALVIVALWMRSNAAYDTATAAPRQEVRQSATDRDDRQVVSDAEQSRSPLRRSSVWLLPQGGRRGVTLMPQSVVSLTPDPETRYGIALMPVPRAIPKNSQIPFRMRPVMPLVSSTDVVPWSSLGTAEGVSEDASTSDGQSLAASPSSDDEDETDGQDEADSLALAPVTSSWQHDIRLGLSMSIPSLELDWRKTDDK